MPILLLHHTHKAQEWECEPQERSSQSNESRRSASLFCQRRGRFQISLSLSHSLFLIRRDIAICRWKGALCRRSARVCWSSSAFTNPTLTPMQTTCSHFYTLVFSLNFDFCYEILSSEWFNLADVERCWTWDCSPMRQPVEHGTKAYVFHGLFGTVSYRQLLLFVDTSWVGTNVGGYMQVMQKNYGVLLGMVDISYTHFIC